MRVIKLVIYEGSSKKMTKQLSKSLENGTRNFSGMQITTRVLHKAPIYTSEIEQVIKEHELAITKLSKQ